MGPIGRSRPFVAALQVAKRKKETTADDFFRSGPFADQVCATATTWSGRRFASQGGQDQPAPAPIMSFSVALGRMTFVNLAGSGR